MFLDFEAKWPRLVQYIADAILKCLATSLLLLSTYVYEKKNTLFVGNLSKSSLNVSRKYRYATTFFFLFP